MKDITKLLQENKHSQCFLFNVVEGKAFNVFSLD